VAAVLKIMLRQANQFQHGVYLLLLVAFNQFRFTFFCGLNKQLSCTIFVTYTPPLKF
jgi:hypothetical protein